MTHMDSDGDGDGALSYWDKVSLERVRLLLNGMFEISERERLVHACSTAREWHIFITSDNVLDRRLRTLVNVMLCDAEIGGDDVPMFSTIEDDISSWVDVESGVVDAAQYTDTVVPGGGGDGDNYQACVMPNDVSMEDMNDVDIAQSVVDSVVVNGDDGDDGEPEREKANRELKMLLPEVWSRWAQVCRSPKERELYEALDNVVQSLKKMDACEPFLCKVNRRQVPSYYTIIQHPMDINTLIKNLKKLQYKSKREFIDDLSLIWINCRLYNSKWQGGKVYIALADQVERAAEELLRSVPDIDLNLEPPPTKMRAVLSSSEVNKSKGNVSYRESNVAYRESSVSYRESKTVDRASSKSPIVPPIIKRETKPAVVPVLCKYLDMTKSQRVSALNDVLEHSRYRFSNRYALQRTPEAMADAIMSHGGVGDVSNSVPPLSISNLSSRESKRVTLSDALREGTPESSESNVSLDVQLCSVLRMGYPLPRDMLKLATSFAEIRFLNLALNNEYVPVSNWMKCAEFALASPSPSPSPSNPESCGILDSGGDMFKSLVSKCLGLVMAAHGVTITTDQTMQILCDVLINFIGKLGVMANDVLSDCVMMTDRQSTPVPHSALQVLALDSSMRRMGWNDGLYDLEENILDLRSSRMRENAGVEAMLTRALRAKHFPCPRQYVAADVCDAADAHMELSDWYSLLLTGDFGLNLDSAEPISSASIRNLSVVGFFSDRNQKDSENSGAKTGDQVFGPDPPISDADIDAMLNV